MSGYLSLVSVDVFFSVPSLDGVYEYRDWVPCSQQQARYKEYPQMLAPVILIGLVLNSFTKMDLDLIQA
jgi:hypothetical protein